MPFTVAKLLWKPDKVFTRAASETLWALAPAWWVFADASALNASAARTVARMGLIDMVAPICNGIGRVHCGDDGTAPFRPDCSRPFASRNIAGPIQPGRAAPGQEPADAPPRDAALRQTRIL